MQHEKIVHELVQGEPAWDQFRLTHRGASEAAAMLGLSSNVTRTELLHAKHTGIAKEFSDFVQSRVLDKGHEVEALARPIIERILGLEFGPVTCSRGKLSASCDGLTMFHETAFEHKQWNDSLAAAVRAKQLPDEHQPQCQQIMMVTGAERVIFVVSDGTEEHMEYMEVLPDPAWQKRILAGWEQFEKDLAEYVPQAAEVKPTGKAPETLPALLVEISGQVKATNLPEFKAHALAVFKGINRDLKTDEDFADAEKTVKWCGDVEDRLKAAKQHALSQTASIDELFRTIDEISSEARRARLDLDKMVTARKVEVKGEIVAAGVSAFNAHIKALNERLGKAYMPPILADFGGAIKGLKSMASMRDAVATTLAGAKIVANEVADRIQLNLTWLRDNATEYAGLFADTATLVLKSPDDFKAVAENRISTEKARVQAEHDKIREEAAEKARNDLIAEQAARATIAVAAQTAAPAVQAAMQDQIETGTGVLANHIAAGLPVVRHVPAAAMLKDEKPTLKLGTINERLGFTVTADFLAELGYTATVERNAKLYLESDWPAICEALIQHITQVADLQAA